MNDDSRPRTNPDVVARQLGEPEGAVLLHLDTGAYHGLNPVGFLIWELIDGTRTVGEIVDVVRANVVDPPETIDHEIRNFLENALARDLVTLSD